MNNEVHVPAFSSHHYYPKCGNCNAFGIEYREPHEDLGLSGFLVITCDCCGYEQLSQTKEDTEDIAAIEDRQDGPFIPLEQVRQELGLDREKP